MNLKVVMEYRLVVKDIPAAAEEYAKFQKMMEYGKELGIMAEGDLEMREYRVPRSSRATGKRK